MRVKYKYGIILTVFLLLLCFEVIAQTQNGPPPPAQMDNGNGPPCAPRGEGGGFPNPPPPGLCLPIDDYIPYLLVGGMLIGLYYTSRKTTKPGEVR